MDSQVPQIPGIPHTESSIQRLVLPGAPAAETTIGQLATQCMQQQSQAPATVPQPSAQQTAETQKLDKSMASVLNNLLKFHRDLDRSLSLVHTPHLYQQVSIDKLVTVANSILAMVADPEANYASKLVGKMTELHVPEHTFVDTTEKVSEMLTAIANAFSSTTEKPVIAVDFEGRNLGRRACADSTSTLQHLLESPAIEKLFWDCRSDNDALYKLFDVTMAGVVDVQLMDLATREKAKDRKSV